MIEKLRMRCCDESWSVIQSVVPQRDGA